MDAILLAARVLLSAVFFVAGGAKLADRDGSRRAVREFGIPEALAGPLGFALPWLELLAAIALLPAGSAWYGAVAALGLLVSFAAAIGMNLARGRTPDCHCFGQLHSAPAGWSTLARNAVFALMAALIVLQGPAAAGPSAVAWIADLTFVQQLASLGATAALALLAAQSFLLVQILRQQGRLLTRMEALEGPAPAARAGAASAAAPAAGRPVGSPAPAFKLPSLQGREIALADILGGGKPALLFFTNPGCGPCSALLPEIARWQRDLTSLMFVVVSEGSAEDNRAQAKERGIAQVLLQEKREVAEAFLAHGTPAAVLVQADGMIGSPVAFGADAIRALVARSLGLASGPSATAAIALGSRGTPIVHAHAPRKQLARGESAPPIELANLDGDMVALPSLRGERSLLLFWNTGCGFCRRMLDDLRAWEADPPPGAPRLVVISAGETEDIRAMELRSLVLLAPDHQVSSAFGADGTPTAILLDDEGRVASSVARGAAAVFALAGGIPAGHNGAARKVEQLGVS